MKVKLGDGSCFMVKGCRGVEKVAMPVAVSEDGEKNEGNEG